MGFETAWRGSLTGEWCFVRNASSFAHLLKYETVNRNSDKLLQVRIGRDYLNLSSYVYSSGGISAPSRFINNSARLFDNQTSYKFLKYFFWSYFIPNHPSIHSRPVTDNSIGAEAWNGRVPNISNIILPRRKYMPLARVEAHLHRQTRQIWQRQHMRANARSKNCSDGGGKSRDTWEPFILLNSRPQGWGRCVLMGSFAARLQFRVVFLGVPKEL